MSEFTRLYFEFRRTLRASAAFTAAFVAVRFWTLHDSDKDMLRRTLNDRTDCQLWDIRNAVKAAMPKR